MKGLITLEDIFVKIMGEDLLDETDEPGEPPFHVVYHACCFVV